MARILLTGGSSFTGLWIAEALAKDGHEVTAVLRREVSDYRGLRAERVERLAQVAARVVSQAPIASARFQALASEGFDLLAHHAADIAGYRSADYDVVDGMNRNLEGVQAAFDAHARSGGRAVIATGTAFEAGEGGGETGDLAVSPYGLSKHLTNEAMRHYARWRGLAFGKFVIAGPFGPMEEGRMCWSLFQRWFKGEVGVVRTPRYVRDNIPVPLLARAYASFASCLVGAAAGADHIARPSGYVGPQEGFALRLAREMAPRLGLACAVETLAQPHLAEPLVRVNDQPAFFPGWPEEAFWDEYARYYQRLADSGLLEASSA